MERLTLADVLCRTVDELVAAFAAKDTAKIEDVRSVLGFLYEVNTQYSGAPGADYTEHYTDADLTVVLDLLLDAIRDWYMGTPFKSTIPSHEWIRSRLA